MSQDLFAAFGDAHDDQNGASHSTEGLTDSHGWQSGSIALVDAPASQVWGSLDPGDEDDDFGDFEDASKSEPPPTAQPSAVPFTAPSHGDPVPPKSTKQPSAATAPAPSNRNPVPPKPTKQPSAPPFTAPSPRNPVPPKPSKQTHVVSTTKEAPGAGSHPFAGHMDLLFGDDDDDTEYNAGADEMTDLATNPEAAMAYSKRVIAEQQAELERKKGPLIASAPPVPPPAPEHREGPNKLQKKSGYVPAKNVVPARNVDVLFDAEEALSEDVDDSWGDFEEPQQSTTRQAANLPVRGPPTTTNDLLALGESNMEFTLQNSLAQKSRTLPVRQSKPSGSAGAMQQPSGQSAVDDDAWDDFEEAAPAPSTAIKAPQPGIENSAFGRSTTAIGGKPPVASSTDTLPPTNIPPPVILLSIFPSLLASGDEALFRALGKLEMKQRQVLLAHPATHMFLRGYLSIAIVLGYIIAGRRLRWKRDQHLAQSMRIGPAAAGGKGGMKLAGVDKGEVAKEEREVLDAVRQWKAQVGKLRTAVASASASTVAGEPKLPPVPDVAEQIPVKALKPSEGGVTAPHACALCGLKREERAAKVDFEVNDSFGEWWVEGMNMHVVCRSFWDEHKGKLRSR